MNEIRLDTTDTLVVPPGRADDNALDRDDHAMPLPGGDWRLWTVAALRASGFPTTVVSQLTSARAAAAADEYNRRRATVIACRKIALADVNDRLKAAEPASRAALRSIRRKLKQGVAIDGASDSARALEHALAERATAYAALTAAVDADADLVATRCRDLLRDDAFREAIVWQNRRALVGFPASTDRGPASAADTRKLAELVAMHAQRYAAKNDTIGFFGPVAWADFGDEPFVVQYQPGHHLIARRTVYFEGWCIDELMASLARDPAIARWMAPRLRSGVWRSGDDIYVPLVGKARLTPVERAILTLCTGERRACDIPGVLSRTSPQLFRSDADVFDVLSQLVRRRIISWTAQVAPQLHPERDCERLIDGIRDAATRQTYQQMWRQVVEARDRVADAAGNSAALDAALDRLDAVFAERTGRPPVRRHGQMYAGRGLVYEDCLRSGELTFGSAFVDRLGPPLSLVLDGARWATAQVRREYGRYLRDCHQALCRAQRTEALDAQSLVVYASANTAPWRERLAAITRDYQERWRRVLAIDAQARRVSYAVDELAARTRDVFAADGDGSWAGYLSPDVLVSAADPAAFARGEFHCVLGEVHGNNSLLWSGLCAQQRMPGQLERAVEADTRGETVVVPQVPPSTWLSRLNVSAPPTAWRYECGDGLPNLPACRSLPAGRLVAVDDGAAVTFRARDGSLAFDAYELFALGLHGDISRLLSDWLPPAPHLPRIVVGDLTMARERWQFTPDELAPLMERDRGARFSRVREWARRHGLPQRVFYKLPSEQKPCYLDLDSVTYVDIFAKLVARLAPADLLRVTEMLPDLGDAWLTDASGRQYTSELRMVVRRSRSRAMTLHTL